MSGRTGLFEPDVLIKDQILARDRTGASASPEKRLMIAVLRDALEDYQKYAFTHDPQGKRVFEETAGWFDSTSNGWFFSFHSICENLGIEPGYLLQELRKWHGTARMGLVPANLRETVNAVAASAAASVAKA
jgi:hypothetical protein